MPFLSLYVRSASSGCWYVSAHADTPLRRYADPPTPIRRYADPPTRSSPPALANLIRALQELI